MEDIDESAPREELLAKIFDLQAQVKQAAEFGQSLVSELSELEALRREREEHEQAMASLLSDLEESRHQVEEMEANQKKILAGHQAALSAQSGSNAGGDAAKHDVDTSSEAAPSVRSEEHESVERQLAATMESIELKRRVDKLREELAASRAVEAALLEAKQNETVARQAGKKLLSHFCAHY
eukprot:SAG31_NODE_4157_length_3525_cov_1.686515_1_plen_182_part_00